MRLAENNPSILYEEQGERLIHHGNAALVSDLVLGFTGDLELQY